MHDSCYCARKRSLKDNVRFFGFKTNVVTDYNRDTEIVTVRRRVPVIYCY